MEHKLNNPHRLSYAEQGCHGACVVIIVALIFYKLKKTRKPAVALFLPRFCTSLLDIFCLHAGIFRFPDGFFWFPDKNFEFLLTFCTFLLVFGLPCGVFFVFLLLFLPSCGSWMPPCSFFLKSCWAGRPQTLAGRVIIKQEALLDKQGYVFVRL